MSTKQHRTANFDEFVKRQQTDHSDSKAANWAQRRDDWLRRLKELYGSVEEFLSGYVEGGTIKISYRDITLNEENIGEYSARQMVLDIGRQQVVLTPIGTILIGTKGRVDIAGAGGKARLVLADRTTTAPQIAALAKEEESLDLTWKIATSPPNVSYVELTQDTLFDLVMEVSNG
jgi:hypothetical protein